MTVQGARAWLAVLFLLALLVMETCWPTVRSISTSPDPSGSLHASFDKIPATSTDLLRTTMADLTDKQLPSRMKDGRTAARVESEVEVPVLENDPVRVEITPHWGGEIHRIYDKAARKDPPPPASITDDREAFGAVALREIDRLPILAAAKPELQRFFRDVAPTFRVAIDTACWPFADNEQYSKTQAIEQGYIDAAPENRHPHLSRGSSKRVAALGELYDGAPWLQGWTGEGREWNKGGEICRRRDATPPLVPHLNFPLRFKNWHLKYSTEAVLPAMIALSQWWTPDPMAAAASVVVAWPLCIKFEKSRCLARLQKSPAWARSNGSTHFFFEMHDWGDCFFMPTPYKVEADGSVGAEVSWKERFRKDLSFATIDRHDGWCLDSTVEPFHNHSHFQNHGLLAGTAAAQLESASYSPGKDIVLPSANAFYPGLPGTDSANIKIVLDEIGRQTDGRGVAGTGSDREYLLVFVMGNDFETRTKVYHHLRAVGRGTPAENTTAAGCDSVDCEYRTTSASKAPYRVYHKVDPLLALRLYSKSKFCIQADGNAPWSPRLVQYVALGCVPVLISDALEPPFNGILDWSKFSIRILPDRIADAITTLEEADHASLFNNLVLVRGYLRYSFDYDVESAGWNTSLPLVIFEMWKRIQNR